MEEHGIKSKRQFAISVDFSPQYLGDCMGTRRPPSTDLLNAISRVYGLADDYWLKKSGGSIGVYGANKTQMPDAGMTPTINVNDTIIYSTAPSAPAPGVYVLEVNGHKTVRRIRPAGLGNVLVVHDNKEYEDYEVAVDGATFWRVEKIVTTRGL